MPPPSNVPASWPSTWSSTPSLPDSYHAFLPWLPDPTEAPQCDPSMSAIHPISIHAASSPIETIVFFFILATLSYFRVLATIKHSSFLPHLHSHPCARHMRSCMAISGLPLPRRSSMLLSVQPITSLSLTFSNYPCPLMVGQQRRCMKTFLLASARIDPSCRLMGVQNYHVLFCSCHTLILLCPLRHQAFLLFHPIYTLTLVPITCPLAWQWVGCRCRDKVWCSHLSAQSCLCHQPSAIIHILWW